MKKMGNDFEKRQKRNVVTFRYNMFIWAAELASVSWSVTQADNMVNGTLQSFTLPGEGPLLASQFHMYGHF